MRVLALVGMVAAAAAVAAAVWASVAVDVAAIWDAGGWVVLVVLAFPTLMAALAWRELHR